MTRPHHLNPRLVLVVALGGAVGTAGRYGLSKVVDPWHGVPLATLIVNLVGAFLLGVLLELLIRAGRETSRRRVIRLGLGTGLMGGLTTYSSFALELQKLLADGRVGLALAYGIGSVVVGTALCALGVILSSRHHHRLVVLLPRDPDARRIDATVGETAGGAR